MRGAYPERDGPKACEDPASSVVKRGVGRRKFKSRSRDQAAVRIGGALTELGHEGEIDRLKSPGEDVNAVDRGGRRRGVPS